MQYVTRSILYINKDSDIHITLGAPIKVIVCDHSTGSLPVVTIHWSDLGPIDYWISNDLHAFMKLNDDVMTSALYRRKDADMYMNPEIQVNVSSIHLKR